MLQYCRWCWPALVRADHTAYYEYTVEVGTNGERVTGMLLLCPRHVARLDMVRAQMELGACSDWPDGVRHDLKALTIPLRDA